MIEQLENSIITRLQTDVSRVEIASLKVAPADYKMIHPRGAILVKYQGAKFNTAGFELGANPADQLGQIPENRALKFEVRLYFRTLQTDKGLYSHLEKVLQSLTGFRPQPGGELLPVSDEFASEVNGIYQYFIIFSLKYP